jgi:S1-C subfamily serine protease
MTWMPIDSQPEEPAVPASSEAAPAPRFRTKLLLTAVVGLAAVALGTGLAFARSSAPRIGKGVVVINTNLGYQDGAAAGTGMVLSSSGEILTNNHVIKGATTIRVTVPGTGHSYSAKVVGYDVAADVAVLQAQHASNLKTISRGDSSRLSVGQAVTALGNAGGAGRLTSANGRITGLGKAITASDEGSDPERLTGLIETNANVQPGDSGGPLLNTSGQVVGMDTAGSTGTSPFAAETASDAYAVPIGEAVTIADQIESGKGSTTIHIGGTPFLGIQVESVDAGYGDAYGGYDQPSSGALIGGVVSNGPAASAGLVAGDVITAIDGHTVTTPQAVASLLLTKKPGATVTVSYTDQYGSSQSATVTLGTGPAQ